MTRIVTKFGIAAALTLGMLSTTAAQTTTTKKKTTTTKKPATSTMAVPVTKDAPGEVVKPDTVTRYVHDTVTTTVYRRDTLTLTGPTVTHWDTVSVVTVPGWLDRGHGVYFGLGAGSYYPSAGLGGGQIPGYAFQMNLGVDPVGSPLGLRITGQLARPDEAQTTANLGGRPSVVNLTADLKLRTPFFNGSRFPMFGLYLVGGGAMVFEKDLRLEADPNKNVQLYPDNTNHSWQHGFGYDAGAGASLQLGHQRELFLEGRVINFTKSGFEGNHQLPIILGVNWY